MHAGRHTCPTTQRYTVQIRCACISARQQISAANATWLESYRTHRDEHTLLRLLDGNSMGLLQGEHRLSGDEFLCHESSQCDHSKTAVVKFLVLHRNERSLILRLHAKGIPSQVPGRVIVLQGEHLASGRILPSLARTSKLGTCSFNDDKGPESRGNGVDLVEVRDCRALDEAVEERGLLVVFLGEESKSSKHGDTAVSDFRLAVALQLRIPVFGESKGIEELTHWRSTADISY
mmetsp:Transcript_15117/g.29715  ORF Transcript_15117/g.29715 Transcript_15117/m.29715 type:complete len:234 (-) Transcript_15117:231-932(-)